MDRRRIAGIGAFAAAAAAALVVGCSGGQEASPVLAPAARLEFGEDPVAGTRGLPLSPVKVVARDASGNVALGYGGPVTLSLRGPGVLSGTTVLPGAGTFDFAAVTVDRPGAEFQLVATGPGLPEATSHTFPVGTPPAGAAGAWPWVVQVGDLDGDGHLDVITANYHSRDLSLLRGAGDGTLGATATIPLPSAPDDMVLADLDADGRLDVITAHWSAGQVLVLAGRAGGGFDPPRVVGSAPGSGRVLAADLDGDGVLDLLVATTAGLQVLRGRGDLTFLAPVVTPAADLDLLALGDLDEDGVPDAVTADWLGKALEVRLGDGAGGFGPATALPPGPELIFPKSLLVADKDRDGHLDVVVVGSWTNGANVLRGDGTGQLAFQSSRWMGVGDVGRGRLADLDGDGRLDVVVTDFACTVTVLRDADPNFRSYYTGARPVGLALADMDEDGLLDAVTSNDLFMDPGSVSVLKGNGDGSFRE